MNLIGKILTFVIFLLSIIFMTMVLTIYATHKNWRDAVKGPQGLEAKLKTETDNNEKLKTDMERLTQEKDKILDDKTQALAKLDTENSLMKSQIKDLQQAVDKYDKSEREAVAALKATQDESAKFREEVTGLRSDAEKAQQDRDVYFKEVVRMTDDIHQMVNEMTELKNRNTTLVADLSRAKEVLRHFKLNENTDITGTPPSVEGLVTAVQGGGMVEISIGSDMGIQKGHNLDIYRVAPTGNKYVGRIEILQAAPNKAVGKIIPSFKQSEVQVGDRVASKINK
jgi:hypothetical protein